MLPAEKIAKAFQGIIEEAEALLKQNLGEDAEKRLKIIMAIGKHQSDVRGVIGSGSCCHKRKECKGHQSSD